MNKQSIQWLAPLALALVVGATGASQAQTAGLRLSVDALNDVLLTDIASGDAVRFTRPQPQAGSTLVVRSVEPVLCASSGVVPGTLQGFALDPNGYLPSFVIGARGDEPELQLATYPDGALFRTADRVTFGDMIYPVPPNYVVVGNLESNCVVGLTQPTAPSVPACTVQADSYTADRIANLSFETGGQLQLQTRIIDRTPSGIYYEHVLTASGGRVAGVQLREMFPYRDNLPGQSRFKQSMLIDSAWVCRASEGAQCSSSAVTDAGRGYAQLDSASLDAGACLRVVAIRPTDSTGQIDNDFSGSLHGAVFYPGHNANGGYQLGTDRSRVNFD
ncbi:MAG: hypothetical protein KF823_07565 [Xanthomonadales bacterium]|nr:hypothetical protein [Xanthomonadales bacterium]